MRLYKSKNHELWFIFQKTKYVWEPEQKEFIGLQFPINNTVKSYSQCKGYADEKEIKEAEEKYGLNK